REGQAPQWGAFPIVFVRGGIELFFRDARRALEGRPRPGKVARVVKRAGEFFGARRRIGVLRAERLLADCQGALVERPRPAEVALDVKQEGEKVEAGRRIGVLRAERLLVDCQDATNERPRPSKAARQKKKDAATGERRR